MSVEPDDPTDADVLLSPELVEGVEVGGCVVLLAGLLVESVGVVEVLDSVVVDGCVEVVGVDVVESDVVVLVLVSDVVVEEEVESVVDMLV